MMKFLLIIVVAVLVVTYFRKKKQRDKGIDTAPKTDSGVMDKLLEDHVRFYKKLNVGERDAFRKRVQHFLDTTRITAVGDAEVTELDRLYVGSSAIIPIFSFSDWAYNNLDEVLIYPGSFTKDFDAENEEKNVLGMVGDGAMHRMMILSLPSLRYGFEQDTPNNTGIHEFVHLLDKSDGAVDGIPEYMIPKELVAPCIKYMHRTIKEIRNNEVSINPYAGTNEAEFFAVLSEYFFQKPQFLAEHHPELFHILEQTYRRNLVQE